MECNDVLRDLTACSDDEVSDWKEAKALLRRYLPPRLQEGLVYSKRALSARDAMTYVKHLREKYPEDFVGIPVPFGV